MSEGKDGASNAQGNQDGRLAPAEYIKGIFAQFEQEPQDERRKISSLLVGAIGDKRAAQEEALAAMQAACFVDVFQLLVKEGVLNKIHSERDPVGECDEPGWRAHYLLTHGRIPVFPLEERFTGREHDESEFKQPRWLQIVMDELRGRDWDPSILVYVFAESGIGNHRMVDLCVADPRQPATEQPGKQEGE